MTDPELLTLIHGLLYRLGLTASYTGFFHTSYAVLLSVRRQECLTAATKWLYPEVADVYGTNWKAVERNIRYTINILWREHPNRLCDLAGELLEKPPAPTKFISLLTARLAQAEKNSRDL